MPCTRFENNVIIGTYNSIALYAINIDGTPISDPLPYYPVNDKTIQVPVTVYKKGMENHGDLRIKAILNCNIDANTVVANSEGNRQKLTLMIYMCGSNLESGFGAASADIEEIKAAGFCRLLQ